MSIILSGLLWRHSVGSVFHCEDLFLHGSSYFPGVNCLSHQIFYVANCSSHHVVSFFRGVNGLSHPIVYAATVQATIIFSFVIGVNCFSHPVQNGANCSSHHVLSFFTGVNCFSHPVQNGANCSSHHVVTCYVSINHPLLMVLTICSLCDIPSLRGDQCLGHCNTIYFVAGLEQYYKVLLINYSILKFHLQILREAVSSYFTLRLHPPILFWSFLRIIVK